MLFFYLLFLIIIQCLIGKFNNYLNINLIIHDSKKKMLSKVDLMSNIFVYNIINLIKNL
jgi:hypothetical protein